MSLASIAAIFLILFQEFGAARIALLIMVNLPLALIGGVAATLFLGGVLNVATMVASVEKGIVVDVPFLRVVARDELPSWDVATRFNLGVSVGFQRLEPFLDVLFVG